MYLHEIGKINIYLGLIKSHNWHIYILADEKASFTKEDLKEGKHIEYARSLLQEIVEKSGKSERCPSSPSSTEQKNASHSDYDWFDVGTSDKQRDGEIITDTDKHNDILSSSDSPKFEHTNPDALPQNSSFATDDDLGLLQGIYLSMQWKIYFRFWSFSWNPEGFSGTVKDGGGGPRKR